MRVLVLANCNYPTLTGNEDLEQVILNIGEVDKIILLGDFLDIPRRNIDRFLSSIEKSFHKLINRILRTGCREIVYVVGDVDQQVLNIHTKVLYKLFGTRYHLVKICDFHIINVKGKMCVFSHGHTQINIAIMEELGDKSDEEILIAAARRARRKEQIAGLRGRLPDSAIWFIGHTNLLYVDREYKIVHCGYMSIESKIRGCGPITRSMYISDKNRGFVLIECDKGLLKLISYPSFKVIDEYVIG